MKKSLYFLSVFICSLILMGLFFVSPTKALLDPDLLLNPDQDVNSIINNNNTTSASPSIQTVTPLKANPSIEVTVNCSGGKFYVSIKFYNYTIGDTIKYTVSLTNNQNQNISTDFTNINLAIDNNRVSQTRDITSSIPASGNYIISVSTLEVTDNVVKNSVNVNLTKDTSGISCSNNISSVTNTPSPSTSITPTPTSTASPTMLSQSSSNAFLGSLDTSKLNTALTGGKTLVQTLNPATNSSGETFWVFVVWRFCMSLINSIMVAFLIFLAFVNILRIQMDTYAIKKILPTLVLAVILANFSLLICRAVVDFSDVLVNTFMKSRTDLAQGLIDALGLFRVGNPAIKVGVGSFAVLALFSAAGGAAGLLVIIAGIIFVLIPGIAILILAFLLWIRVIIVQVLVAFAPLAFIAMALPMTKTWFAKWWGQFANWVFMAVVIFFLLRIVTLIQPARPEKLEIWTLIAAYVILYLTIQIPFKMGGAVMSAWAGFGKTIAGINKGGWSAGLATMFGKRIGANFMTKSPKLFGTNFSLGKLAQDAMGNKELFDETTKKTLEESRQAFWMRKAAPILAKEARDGDGSLTAEERRIRSMATKIAVEEGTSFADLDPAGINRILQGQLSKTGNQEEIKKTWEQYWNGDLFKKDEKKALMIASLISALQRKRNSYTEGQSAQDQLDLIGNSIDDAIGGSAGGTNMAGLGLFFRTAARPAIDGINNKNNAELNGFLNKANLNPLEAETELNAKIIPTISKIKIDELKNIPIDKMTSDQTEFLHQLGRLYEQFGNSPEIQKMVNPILSLVLGNPHLKIKRKELFKETISSELEDQLGFLAESKTITLERKQIPIIAGVLRNRAQIEPIIEAQIKTSRGEIDNLLKGLKDIKSEGKILLAPEFKIDSNNAVSTIDKLLRSKLSNETKIQLDNIKLKVKPHFDNLSFANAAKNTLNSYVAEQESVEQAVEGRINSEKPNFPEEYV
jgi:hypothetical protein